MALDFSKKSKALLLDLINTKATRTLEEGELQFGAVETSSEHEKNTKIHLSAVEDSPTLSGQQDFFYNRLDLTTVFADVQDQVTFTASGTSVNTGDVIASIATTFKLGIAADDIVVSDEDVSSKPESITIRAKEGGLVYTGQLVVKMQYIQVGDDLATVLANNVAEGFEKPTISIGG